MIHHICKRKILIHYYLDWTVNTLSGLRAWTGYLGGGSTLRLNTYHSAASLVTQHMIHAVGDQICIKPARSACTSNAASSRHPSLKADATEGISWVYPPFLVFIWTATSMVPSTTDATVSGDPNREGDAALLARFVRCTSVFLPYLNVVGSSQMHSMRALRS